MEEKTQVEIDEARHTNLRARMSKAFVERISSVLDVCNRESYSGIYRGLKGSRSREFGIIASIALVGEAVRHLLGI
jgi:hypothetical protein